jgi:hypothetical protein
MWFHSELGDIIIPTEPTMPALAPQLPHTENQLLSILRPLAVRAKQAYDADTTGRLGS